MKRENKSIQLHSHRVLLAAAIGAVALSPKVALAEGLGANLLIPAPAEFFPALIAFLIIWFLLAKFFWPKVLDNLDARQKKIQEDLDAAAQTKLDAEAEVEAYKAKIQDAEAKAEQIIAEAKRTAEAESARIKTQANQEAQEIVTRAHEAVENERKNAMTELAGQAADLSVDLASKIIAENLDASKQQDLIKKYLQEVGSLNVK